MTTEKRIAAVSEIVGGWLCWVGYIGFGVVFLSSLDGKTDQSITLMIVWFGAMLLLALPLTALWATRAFITLRTAWRTGEAPADTRLEMRVVGGAEGRLREPGTLLH